MGNFLEEDLQLERKFSWKRFALRSLSYVLVAVVAAYVTLMLFGQPYSKLTELESVIDRVFIGDYDKTEIEDAAVDAMVAALGDRWSLYLSAEEYEAYLENVSNSFVGIGVTVTHREDNTGEDIVSVVEGGPAEAAGLLVGDTIIKVDGQSIEGLDTTQAKALIVGEEGTNVDITVLRNGEEKTFTIERRRIKMKAATGKMLDGNIGLVRIENFHEGCGDEAIAAVEALREQGATALIFDVRFNPGGYVDELIKILDHLLPEGVLFREVDYRGAEGTRYSDADCIEMPMAVLVNGDSYSAAEFFAACLREYDWATVVGEQTCGKGYFQNTIRLKDGSAVNLSIGKYFTPDGVSLTEVGGLTPDAPVTVDDETAALIYANLIEPENDPQLQVAIQEVLKKAG